jgi:hypothetical protein
LATRYPTQIDGQAELPETIDLVTPVQASVVNNLRGAIIATQTELGSDPSREFGTVRARIDALEGRITVLEQQLSGGVGLRKIRDEGTLIIDGVDEVDFIGNLVTVTKTSATTADITIASDPVVQVQETISVTAPGQTAFTLAQAPLDDGAVEMFINGLKQQHGVDYSVSGTTVTYLGTPSLITTDVVEFWYMVAGVVGPGGSGEINIGANVGSGTGQVYRDKTGVFLNFKAIAAGTGIGVANGADDITISTTAEANLGSNVGSATGEVFRNKTSATLNFKTLNAGTGISITNNANTIDITNTSTNDNEISFILAGIYSGATIDGYIEPPYPIVTARTISSVTLMRRTAGDGGATRIDVLKNGSSIFDGPTKPQVAYTEGDNAIDTVTSFDAGEASLSVNDYLDIQLEAVETGSPEGLTVVVRF